MPIEYVEYWLGKVQPVGGMTETVTGPRPVAIAVNVATPVCDAGGMTALVTVPACVLLLVSVTVNAELWPERGCSANGVLFPSVESRTVQTVRVAGPPETLTLAGLFGDGSIMMPDGAKLMVSVAVA
jgi:hypothetical protein